MPPAAPSTPALEDLLHPLLARYLAAPAWLKASAGRAYAWLPQRVRLGGAYERFRAALDDTADARAIASYAQGRLEETLAWALDTVPAYEPYRGILAGRDPRDALRLLPVTDKLDIKRDPARYLSRAMPERARLRTFTGGSTRTPMQFFLEKHVTRSKEYAFMHDFRDRVCAGPRERVLALRGRTVPGAGRPDGPVWMYEPIRRQLVLSTDHLEKRFMPAYMEALAAHRPAFIEAFPSALYPLARWLAEHPLPELTRGVRGVMLFSENVHGFQLEKFREVFQCPVVAHYGHSERVLMAATMPDDDRYFFWPQYGWLELVDARDRPVTRPGRLGFIVGTSFDNRVMPFVRYRTGDLGVLGERAHPRLPGFPVVERIAGRLQEFVVCRDHRLVSITTLGVAHFPELATVDAIQYEQWEPGRVLMQVVADGALSGPERRAIAEAVAAKTQGGCEIAVVQVPRIARTPRGKARMLVQHLDIRRYFAAAMED